MRILALETSSQRGSVAVLEAGQVMGQTEIPPGRGTAQGLAPAIAAQLQAVGWHPQQIALVAVAQGPGSFTGLRVGVTTAKTLAYALGAELLGVDTLEVLAAQLPWQETAPGQGALIGAVLDAQRQQLYAAGFRQRRDALPEILAETRLRDYDSWIATLQPGQIVTGTGLHRVLDRLPAEVVVAAEPFWTPQAASVGQLAWRHYQAGRRDDLWKLVPHYYRRSAAEEKWDSRKS